MLALDCHAHISPTVRPVDLERLDACVVAVTRSLGEFEMVSKRKDSRIAWALGAHPAVIEAHRNFSVERLRPLLAKASVVGEVGLDGRCKVPINTQQETLEAILACLSESPRLASVHSVSATGPVLELLADNPVPGIILHWWKGTKVETLRAIELGCYFSVNAAEASRPRVLDLVPMERVLTETDHPFGDREEGSERRPGRVSLIEKALAREWNIVPTEVRRRVWRNFFQLASEVGGEALLPSGFQRSMLAAGSGR